MVLLQGDWSVEADITNRLRQTPDRKRTGLLSFRSDPEVAKSVPAKYDEFLAEKHVFMAGYLQRKNERHPFILIEHRGNPFVVYFGERDGNPMGNAESFNVMLAPGENKEDDLLFIGGDFNNQAFDAYERAGRGREDPDT